MSCVLYLREPMGTDIPNSWNTSSAMAGLITSRLWTLVGVPLCPGYWHNFEGLQYFPRPYRWRGQTRNFLTCSCDKTFEPSPLQDDHVLFEVYTRQKTFFLVVQLNHLLHSYRNTVSERPREDPQSKKPFFDKEQASAMITWLFLFLDPLTPASADP